MNVAIFRHRIGAQERTGSAGWLQVVAVELQKTASKALVPETVGY